MKNFHSVTATVFAKEKENKSKIEEGLKEFFPLNLDKEKIKINIQKSAGFEDKKIEIISIKIEKQKHIKIFLDNLFEKLTEAQIRQIIDEIETRIDEEGFFYLRFDKNSWIKDKTLFITDEGNCYHLKFKIAAYPCNKERAIIVMKEFLQQYF